MILNNAPSSTHVCARVSLLLALFLTPLAVEAQGIAGFDVYRGADFRVGALVTLSGSASHYPATITIDWGDGSSNYTRAQNPSENSKRLRNTYANCGVKSISLTVSFNGGASLSRSAELSVPCPSAQPPVGSAIHCGIYGCRHVPNYFVANDLALVRWLEDANRRRERGDHSVRPLSDFGYRCPDTRGLCDASWLPGPGDSRGLSSPNRYVGSSDGQRIGGNVQRINADGIGVKWIVDQNPIDAVDVWGPGAEGGGEVCFKGTEGRLIYLDARTSPRAQSELSTRVRGDEICGTMPGPGSVVYLPPAG